MNRTAQPWMSLLAVLLATGLSGTTCVIPFMPADDGGGDDGGDEKTFPIALQIDAENEDTVGLARIMGELQRRGIDCTVFVTADYANKNALRINELYRDGHEIALHGYYTGEQLASMTLAEQRDLLSRAKLALEGCQPCGTYKPISGFRPQYFSQNHDTYTVLDELGLTYDCGFKVGQVYEEGHADDTEPYAIEGHDLNAVPITTVAHAGETVYLCDIACALVQEYSGETWSTVLSDAIAQSKETGQPLIVLFHGWYTGAPESQDQDYWTPFVNFLDELGDAATFVTTKELVEQYATPTSTD